jgi:hypothetical protein
MSIIPLDVQRRCERRWAARFSRPTESVAPRNQRPEREGQQIAGPGAAGTEHCEPGGVFVFASTIASLTQWVH